MKNFIDEQNLTSRESRFEFAEDSDLIHEPRHIQELDDIKQFITEIDSKT